MCKFGLKLQYKFLRVAKTNFEKNKKKHYCFGRGEKYSIVLYAPCSCIFLPEREKFKNLILCTFKDEDCEP